MTTFFFIRHGQGDHNILPNGHNIHDPPLNPTGLDQAKLLSKAFTNRGLVPAIILCSPLKRTIETSLHVFPTQKPILLPILKEIGKQPCNIGSAPSVLGTAYPQINVKELANDWWVFDQFDIFEEALVQLKKYLGFKMVAVVAHADFIHEMVGSILGNCEARSYTLNKNKFIHLNNAHEEITRIYPVEEKNPTLYSDFIFYSKMDCFGYDIMYYGQKNNIKDVVTKNKKALGWNTVGYIKFAFVLSSLTKMGKSVADGIYIKKPMETTTNTIPIPNTMYTLKTEKKALCENGGIFISDCKLIKPIDDWLFKLKGGWCVFDSHSDLKFFFRQDIIGVQPNSLFSKALAQHYLETTTPKNENAFTLFITQFYKNNPQEITLLPSYYFPTLPIYNSVLKTMSFVEC
jgi:hypothetical protein